MLVRLASGSPRRLELLRQIGLEVDVYTSVFDEVSGDNAEKVVAVNALGKGQVVVEQVGSEIPVIAADTMVKYLANHLTAMMQPLCCGNCLAECTGF